MILTGSEWKWLGSTSGQRQRLCGCTWGERGGVYHLHRNSATVGGRRCHTGRYPTVAAQCWRQGGCAAGSADSVPPPLPLDPGGPPQLLDCPGVRVRFAAALETVGGALWTLRTLGDRRLRWLQADPLHRWAVRRQGCSRQPARETVGARRGPGRWGITRGRR